MAASRFCPYCGLANAADYSFCQRCGKPLPLPGASAPVTTASPFPMPPPPADEFGYPGASLPGASYPGDEPVERPLTEAERSALKGSQRFRNGNAARAFGTILGITPIMLIMMSMIGLPLDPSSVLPIALVAGFLGMFLGVASAKLLTPIRAALKSGQASEARGVPEKRPDPSGKVAVTFGDLDFLMKPSLADRLPEGELAELSFVVVGMERDPRSSRAQAIVLGVNGQAGTPEDASLTVAPEVAQSLRAFARPGGRK